MNRRSFLSFLSVIPFIGRLVQSSAKQPTQEVFGWKQEASQPESNDIGLILAAIERETQSWVGMTEYRLFLKYDLSIEHIGEWGSIRSIQPLRDAVAKKFGLPPDHILLFGVRFISSDSNPLRRKSADAWSRQFYRKLESVYNIEIFKPIQGVKEFPGRKGHWIQVT